MYLLCGFSEQMKPYKDCAATNVISLLSTYPRYDTTTHKELLLATRHILITNDFCSGFFHHVDSLLDKCVLVGTH